jgi:antitoxin MazE
MTTTIQKWGNSLALRIPKSVANQLEVAEGDLLQMTVQGHALTLRPEPPHYDLDQLLAGITSRNTHSATEWSEPVGREVW